MDNFSVYHYFSSLLVYNGIGALSTKLALYTTCGNLCGNLDNSFLLFGQYLLGWRKFKATRFVVADESNIGQGIEDRLQATHQIVRIEFPGMMNGHGYPHAIAGSIFDELIPMPRTGSPIEQFLLPELPELAVGMRVPIFTPQFIRAGRHQGDGDYHGLPCLCSALALPTAIPYWNALVI